MTPDLYKKLTRLCSKIIFQLYHLGGHLFCFVLIPNVACTKLHMKNKTQTFWNYFQSETLHYGHTCWRHFALKFTFSSTAKERNEVCKRYGPRWRKGNPLRKPWNALRKKKWMWELAKQVFFTIPKDNANPMGPHGVVVRIKSYGVKKFVNQKAITSKRCFYC